jgi:hypothetical protein
MKTLRLLSVCSTMAIITPWLSGCEAPSAFPAPAGPARPVAVDVALPLYVLGNWTIGSFTDALRVELAKYNVDVVDPRSRPVLASFRVDLGEITYREWQALDVAFVVAGQPTPIGSVRLPDLSTSTVEAAALPVATLFAQRVWGPYPLERSSRPARPIDDRVANRI